MFLRSYKPSQEEQSEDIGEEFPPLTNQDCGDQAELLVRLEVGPSKFCQEAKKRLRLAKVQARKVKACLEVKLRFLLVKLVKVQLEALEFLSLALEFLSLALIFLFQTRETVQ
ncbi:hypothetical protein quinque_013885 [Culex quinquefasciatus]